MLKEVGREKIRRDIKRKQSWMEKKRLERKEYKERNAKRRKLVEKEGRRAGRIKVDTVGISRRDSGHR